MTTGELRIALAVWAAAVALACGRNADSPSNASTDESYGSGATNEQPGLGSVGNGDDGTNGGMYNHGAVGAGFNEPTTGGATPPGAMRRGRPSSAVDGGSP